MVGDVIETAFRGVVTGCLAIGLIPGTVLAQTSGSLVVPVGHAGARRIASGSAAKQLAGTLTAPVRRPRCHVHLGAPMRLPAETERGTAAARLAVTTAWRTAVRAVGERPVEQLTR